MLRLLGGVTTSSHFLVDGCRVGAGNWLYCSDGFRQGCLVEPSSRNLSLSMRSAGCMVRSTTLRSNEKGSGALRSVSGGDNGALGRWWVVDEPSVKALRAAGLPELLVACGRDIGGGGRKYGRRRSEWDRRTASSVSKEDQDANEGVIAVHCWAVCERKSVNLPRLCLQWRL